MAEFNEAEQKEIKKLARQVLSESGTNLENVPEEESFNEGDYVPFIKNDNTVAKIQGTSIGSGGGGGGGDVTVDDELSNRSTNPVQNKAIKSAIDKKQDTLVGSGTGQNVKTINGESIVGTGNIVIQGGGGTGTVSGVKVGSDGTVISPTDGVVTIPSYEDGAQKHIAPTASEVKNALGTGSGTARYLREDGTWATPPSGGGDVTGVKGDSETQYRTGNVNITKANIGLGDVGNFKAVSTVASQGLSDTEKSNARTNIGAGTSSFSGSYNDLINKPTIPTVPTNVSAFTNDAGYLTQHQDISGKADKIDTYTKTEVDNLISSAPESDVIVVAVPSGEDIATYLTDNIPAEQKPNNVFRVPGDTSYSEWGWNGTAFVMLAEKEYGFDNEPESGSTNPVTSGGIYSYIDKFMEISGRCSADEIGLAFTDKMGNILLGFGNNRKIYSSLFNTDILNIDPSKILQDSFYERNKGVESMLLADCFYNPDPWGTQTKKLQLMIITDTHEDVDSMSGPINGANNFKSVDAVVHLGDFTYWTNPDEDTYKQVSQAIATCEKPLYMTPGNHDVGARSTYVKYCKDDAALYKRFIKPSVDMGALKEGEYQENVCYYYHDFDEYKVRLIMLYPNDDGNVFDETYWEAISRDSSYPEITTKTYSVGDCINVSGHETHSFRCKQAVTVTQIGSSMGTYTQDLLKNPRYKALRYLMWYSQAQLTWFCSKISEAGTKGYTCIIGQHPSFFSGNFSDDKTTRFNNPYKNGSAGVNWTTYPYRYAPADRDIITQIVNAYQNGTRFNKTITPINGYSGDTESGVDDTSSIPSVTIDYTFGSHGNVLFIHGHSHCDVVNRSTRYAQTDIGFISGTLKDASLQDIGRRYLNADTKPMDTATALTMDGNKIHLTRIGACITNRIDETTNRLITKENEIITY